MAALTPVFLDYETFWSTTHSLTKMNPIEYVMHPETEIISVACKVGTYQTDVLFGEDNIRKALQKIDWSDKIVVSHNNEGFDSMISRWRMGIKPKMWGCTLAMARPIHAKSAGGSLKKLVEHYNLGVKDNSALLNTKGRHLKDFSDDEIAAMREYNKTDTEQCAKLFYILQKTTSKDEMRLIDMTIRTLVEPKFVVNEPLLVTELAAEKMRKKQALAALAIELYALENPALANVPNDENREVLMDVLVELLGKPAEAIEEDARAMLASATKFAAFLEGRGVAPPRKMSPTTGKETYALAKTDEAFVALQTHDDPLVAAATLARLDIKSTILETRIEAFLAASRSVKGRLPVTLKYYGADTTGRWSGWGYNPQNLPRVAGKPSDCLRNSLQAPEGMKVIVADLSGIELRVNMFLWKVPYAMKLFQDSPDKADLYKSLAADVFDVPYDEVEKMQRQAAKAMHLGCGFGLGTPSKFQVVAKTIAGLVVEEADAKEYITSYRTAHPEIVQGWKTCHRALDAVYQDAPMTIDPWGMCKTTAEGIQTPRGIIRYPGLRKEVSEGGKTEWFYGEGRHKARIYAGKVTENIVQHLARCIIADNALDFRKRTGLNPALMVHDELVYVVKEEYAQTALDELQAIMRTPPTWWSDLIVWSEGDVADTYGSAKG